MNIRLYVKLSALITFIALSGSVVYAMSDRCSERNCRQNIPEAKQYIYWTKSHIWEDRQALKFLRNNPDFSNSLHANATLRVICEASLEKNYQRLSGYKADLKYFRRGGFIFDYYHWSTASTLNPSCAKKHDIPVPNYRKKPPKISAR